MPHRFDGKNILVTGASRGIGAALAERLAAEGAAVAISARTVDAHPTLPGSLAETAARMREYGNPVQVIAAALDDADDRARIVPEAVAALGPLDVLVNNAAAAIYQPMVDYPLKRRRLSLEVNFQAPVDLMQAALPAMLERNEGWVVNVTSQTARQPEGPPFVRSKTALTYGVYGASKAALNRVTGAFAAELHGSGVRVNAVEPRGAVMTEGAEVLVGGTISPEQMESVESMVEGILVLCDCEPDMTGGVFTTLDLLDERDITVMSLDGTTPHPNGQKP